jgi:hypothetical protein
MPGYDTRVSLERRETLASISPTQPTYSSTTHRVHAQPERVGHSYVQPPPSPHSSSPYSASYPAAVAHGGASTRIIERDPSRTLPPLIFRSTPPPTPSSQQDPFGLEGAAPVLPPIEFPQRTPSPTSAGGSRVFEPVRRAVPPPFTLQPAPQWDPAMAARPPRSSHSPPMALPGLSSAPLSVPAPRRIFSDELHPVARVSGSELGSGPELSPTLPSPLPTSAAREARFDPVRSTFVPLQRTPSPVASPSDHRSQGQSYGRSSRTPSPSSHD